jgi:phosphatidylinositol glycan class T
MFLILLLGDLAYAQSTFHESLDIRPVQNGLLLAQFMFEQSITVPSGPVNQIDYSSFPGAMEELVRDFGLEELRLSFGRGRWDQQVWGQAPFALASTGIQLHAWFEPNSPSSSVSSRWARLTHTLSGLLCASIGLLNDAKTSVPSMTIPRQNPGSREAELRFGVLPREAVCTENLTPWIKMLPCMSNVPPRLICASSFPILC